MVLFAHTPYYLFLEDQSWMDVSFFVSFDSASFYSPAQKGLPGLKLRAKQCETALSGGVLAPKPSAGYI